MCGIVGYVTSSNKVKYEKFFKQALIADVLRGFDSTGVIVGNTKGYDYMKKAVNSLDFLDMKQANAVVNKLAVNQPAFMIGHNRAATVGNVVSANAHPFQHGDICGVHNGTLRKFSKLEDNNKFGTDSEALYYNLSYRPLADVLSDVQGAYALVWYDNAEGTLNIIRNDERPLALAKVKDDDTVLWASEEGMLKWLAGRNDIEIEHIMNPKPNVHCKFHLNAKEVSSFEYEEVEVKDNYPAPPVRNNLPAYHHNQHGYRKDDAKSMPSWKLFHELGLTRNTAYDVYMNEFTPYATTGEYGVARGYMMSDPWAPVELRGFSRKDFHPIDNEVVSVTIDQVNCDSGNLWDAITVGKLATHPIPTFMGPNNQLIDYKAMVDLTSGGCAMCGNTITVNQFDQLDWFNNEPLCPGCVDIDYEGLEA